MRIIIKKRTDIPEIAELVSTCDSVVPHFFMSSRDLTEDRSAAKSCEGRGGGGGGASHYEQQIFLDQQHTYQIFVSIGSSGAPSDTNNALV